MYPLRVMMLILLTMTIWLNLSSPKLETMRPSIRPLKPDSPQKNQQMARPFETLSTGLFLQRPTVPQGTNSKMDIGFQNKYTALEDYPRLQVKTPTKLINQKIEQGTTSSLVQTKECYTMKAPETFAKAVKPVSGKKHDTSPPKKEFEFLTKQVLPIMAIDK
ncbi:hypothetical protein H5410_028210 [Solanum commersonii]|uniref:Uncharacterized protein n=1 Tax=Solanum commersonii TaxID=4109 RepID=A0A9J5Z6U1_SOLCO|nr:hypothetical protein H5410_028210 [Solanum commersonii]